MKQLSFDDVNKNTDNPIPTMMHKNKDNLFGCCSQFRECSNAKKCVISDREYSKFCIYRNNLENGNIFYGKNANDFDIHIYNSFISAYKSLNVNDTNLFCEIVNTIILKLRNYLWLECSNSINALADKKLLTIDVTDEILEYYQFGYLKKVYRKYYPNIILPQKKDELLALIRKDKPKELYGECVNKYCKVYLDAYPLIFYSEFYHDYVFGKSFECIKFDIYDIKGIKKPNKNRK